VADARAKISPRAPCRGRDSPSRLTDSTAGNYLYTERELILSPSVLAFALRESDPVHLLSPPGQKLR